MISTKTRTLYFKLISLVNDDVQLYVEYIIILGSCVVDLLHNVHRI
jgi:hypothetical protein